MPLRFLLRYVTRLRFLIALFLAPPLFCRAQTNLTIYADALGSGWQDYSYGITSNFAATARFIPAANPSAPRSMALGGASSCITHR